MFSAVYSKLGLSATNIRQIKSFPDKDSFYLAICSICTKYISKIDKNIAEIICLDNYLFSKCFGLVCKYKGF